MLAVTLLAMSVAVVLAGEKVEPPTRAEKIADGVQKVVDAIANNVEDVATNVCSDNLADATQCDLFKDTLVAEIAKADADLAVIDENLRGVFLERVSDDAAKRDAIVDELETLIDADEVDQTAIDAKIAEHADLVDEQTIDLQVRDTLFENDAAKKTARDAFLADFDAAVAASDARVAKLEKIFELGVELTTKIDVAEENEQDFADREALQAEVDKLLEEHEEELAAIGKLLPNGTQRFALAKKVFDAREAEAENFVNEDDEEPLEEGEVALLRNPIRLTHVVQDDLVDHTDLAATYPDVTYELVDESADKKRAEAAEPTYEANCASNLELEEDANELCKQQLAQFIGESESKFSTVLVLDSTDIFAAESTELEKVAKAAKWEPSWSAKSEKKTETESDPYAKSSEDHHGHDHSASEAEEEDSATLASLSLSLLSLVGLRSLF